MDDEQRWLFTYEHINEPVIEREVEGNTTLHTTHFTELSRVKQLQLSWLHHIDVKLEMND